MRTPVAVLHLDGTMLAAAEAGRQNFVTRLGRALAGAGWELRIARASALAEIRAARGGHSLWHMIDPPGPGGLTIRRTYVGAFWHIERCAARWDWPVAAERYDPATAAAEEPPGADAAERARAFVGRWRAQMFPGLQPRRAGHVFVPLQARLLERRSFQAMSPIAMLETVLARWPGRPVEAALHPRVSYDRDERDALTALGQRHPALRLSKDGAPGLLAGADLVVTQNSSVAFHGFFFGKPALLFAGSDFHHAAASVPRDGLDAALDACERPAVDLPGYLWWFLRRRAINAGAPEAEAQILAALRRGGWPI